MEIRNARIQKVSVNVSYPGPKTIVSIDTISATGNWTYEFTIPTNRLDSFSLHAMLEFTGVKNTNELEGRIVREIVCNEKEVIAFGDPVEDKFFILNRKEEYVSMMKFF